MVLLRPRGATHAHLTTLAGKRALVTLADLDTLAGSKGKLKWLRITKRDREVLGTVQFDGQIDEVSSDYQRKRKNQ